ncbi:MAG: SPOR domain-containing protein [Bacteroidota bacterium]
MKKISFFISLFFISVFIVPVLYGQVTYNDTNNTGMIEIIQDPRIDALVKKHIAINEKQKGIQGYRVQIFFGSKKRNALEVKTDFTEKYPTVEAHLLYDQPYFKIRVGDFRTRLKAEKLSKEISGDFPNAFIVSDLITMPEIE